jgi:hypothetical protein
MLSKARRDPVKVVRPIPGEWWRSSIDHLIRGDNSKLLVGLLFLIGVDVGFVMTYSLHEIYISLYNDNVPLLSSRWSIRADRSYPEMFGYAKTTILVALLIIACRLSGKSIYAIWAGVFTYVILDDALLVHERLGRAVAGPSSSTWAWDMGQLVVWVLVGMILLAIAVTGLARSSGRDRTNGVLLLLALAALGFFAVIIDLVHVIARSWFRGSNLLFTVLEEGGEQLVLTLVLALAVQILRSQRYPPPAGELAEWKVIPS